MATSAREFLERSVPGRHPHLPESMSGTLRLDIYDGARTEHWYLTVDRQNVGVTRSAEDADLIVCADREVFDWLAAGRTDIPSALIRNEVTAEGDLPLLMSLHRLFPGSPEARHPREFAREREGRP